MQLAVGFPVGPALNALDIAGAIIAHRRKGRGIHAHQVARRKQHHHRPVSGDTVQMIASQTCRGQEDRVKTPGDQRLVRTKARSRVFQPGKNGTDFGQAGPWLAVRVDTVVKPHVGVIPETGFRHVAVPFDKAGHQNGFRQPVVVTHAAPLIGAGRVTHGQNMAVAHRDMGGRGPVRVHGDDLCSLKDSDPGHRHPPFSFKA